MRQPANHFRTIRFFPLDAGPDEPHPKFVENFRTPEDWLVLRAKRCARSRLAVASANTIALRAGQA